MFCEECGTKNKKNAAFCENCGHKMTTEEPKKEEVKVVKKVVKKDPMSKSKKILIGAIAIVVVALIGTYMYVGSLFTPEKVAVKYFKAYAAKDADKLCDTIKLDESEFVSKKLLKAALKDEEKINIGNYSTEKSKDSDGISTSVTIKYVEEGSAKEKYKTIKLTKDKKKKYLFFDNWTVDSSELIVKDYSFSVPVNSTPSIDGVEVSDKYKEDSYSSYYDKYEIPSILKGSYKLTTKLKSGLVLEGNLKVNNSYSSFSSSSLKLESATEKKILKEIKEKVSLIYDAVTSDKSFDDIKDKFDEDYRDDIEYSYNNLKEYALSDYNKLKEFKLKDVSIRYFNISDDNLELTVQIKYDYKVEYKNGDETKEYSKTGKTDSIYVTYKLDKKEYVMSNIKSLISYFSHYSY